MRKGINISHVNIENMGVVVEWRFGYMPVRHQPDHRVAKKRHRHQIASKRYPVDVVQAYNRTSIQHSPLNVIILYNYAGGRILVKLEVTV